MIENQTIYHFLDFRADTVNKILRRGEIAVPLTPKVFDTLVLLLENAPNLVEKNVLMDKLWQNQFVEESNITFNIKMLRKALDDDANSPTFIETVPRRGYRFIAEVRKNIDAKPVETVEKIEVVETVEIAPNPLKTSAIKYYLFIGAILLVAILGFTFFFRNPFFHNRQSFQQINTNRLTSTGKEFYSIISPDGKYIIHAKDEGEKQSLWIRQTAETRDIEIVPPTVGQIFGLSVSPDSKSVFYTLAQENSSEAVLYQVPILGGTSKQIISNIDSGISFSADGNEFVFYRTNQNQAVSQLIIANADGTNQRVVAERNSPETFETEFGNPIWKSNERKILAIVTSNAPNAKSDVVEIDIETGAIKPFIEANWKDIQQIAWLKNSNSLLLVAFDEDSISRQIFHIEPKTKKYRKVTSDVNNYRGISLTDDEKTLITTQTEQVTNLFKTKDKTATTAEEVLSEKGNISGDEGLAWTAENELVFSLGEQNFDNIMIQDGGGIHPLTVNTNGNRQPTVCGDKIVYATNFVSSEPNAIRLWKMDKDGKNPQKLTVDEGENEMFPTCSPKSDWIIYQRGLEKPTLWKVPIAGGKSVQLTDNFSYQPTVSPDGKMAAYYNLENYKWNIIVVNIEDGKLFKQIAISPKSKLRHLRWTPDGKNLAYSDTQNGVSNIWLQPLNGTPPIQLTKFETETIFYFGWSPNGENFAYTRGSITSDIISISDVK